MKNQDTCSHTHKVDGHWEKRPDFNQAEYDCGGFEVDEHDWVDGYDKPTTIDINLHQYKCTQCGKIFG